MRKTSIFFLALLAIISVIIAFFVVRWTRKLDKMMEDELNPVVVEPIDEDEKQDNVNKDSLNALQESFDALLSWESIEELYEGETDFGFIEADE